MNVPFMDLSDCLKGIREEIDERLKTLIDHNRFIGGEEVELFESEFTRFCGIRYAVGCSNGTDALIIAMKALGIGQGDIVLVPVNTFIATAEAVTAAGAAVEFVDIDEKSYNISIDALENHLAKEKSGKIKAVIPVHLYGQMADMESVSEVAHKFGLKVIEDSSQAHGAASGDKTPGEYGDIATFSFYPGKNLGAFGDAGAIVTKDESLYKKCKMLVDHGRWQEKYIHSVEGYNKRLDSIQAAVLRIKLKKLPEQIAKRIERADLYLNKLDSIMELSLPH